MGKKICKKDKKLKEENDKKKGVYGTFRLTEGAESYKGEWSEESRDEWQEKLRCIKR